LISKTPDETHDELESQRRFEAALRGAQLVPPRPMKDFIGKGERALLKKSRVKKSAQESPK
jgi:hypothetical protein